MPASLPGSTLAENLANPSAGALVIFDPVSGPKGSPLDNDTQVDIVTGASSSRGGCSTGALQTGIGFGSPPVLTSGHITPNFTDDYIPGQSDPASTDTGTSVWMYIGGGRCNANVDGYAAPNPYTSGMTPILAAGNGGTRDAGTGPAYTGYYLKTVTASGTVANGSAVETGFTNRSGMSIVAGQSVFGVSTAGSTAIS
jgi:hypothetical protein